MALEVIDETNGHKVICQIPNGSAALLGIDGAADTVQLLAVAGTVLFKQNGIVADNIVIGSSAAPTTGSVTTDASGIATISTSVGQPVLATNVDTISSTQYTVRTGNPSSTYNYSYW